MAHPKQNLPRSLRGVPQESAVRSSHVPTSRQLRIAIAALLAASLATTLLLVNRTGSQAAAERKIDRYVTRLLAGVPQHGKILGQPSAPVTMEVFLDLKDPDSRSWILNNLPAIVKAYVRPGTLRLEYHAYKTNTFSPQEFVDEQTAALAAGAQDKLWNYLDTFYQQPRRARERSEFESYATNAFLENVARQVPGLDIPLWQADRHTGRREEQTTAEDQTARKLGLHVTPSFRIGSTGHPLHNYAGREIIKYGEQHPIALPTAQELSSAVRELKAFPTSG